MLSFIAPVALYLLLMFAYPVGYSLWLAFQSYDLKSLITGESVYVELENFRTLVASADFSLAVRNTVVFTVASIVVQYVIGLALALFFYRVFPLSRVSRALMILPWLVPSIVATTSWRFMFAERGFLNQLLHVVGLGPVAWLTSPSTVLLSVIIVNIWVGISFNLVLLHSGLQGIPVERYEAAQLDGAGAWKKLVYITLPALRPVTAIILTLGFIYTLKQFDLIWTLTRGGPGNSSQLLSTLAYQYAFVESSFGMGAAVNMILFVVSGAAIVVYSIRQHRSSRGQQ